MWKTTKDWVERVQNDAAFFTNRDLLVSLPQIHRIMIVMLLDRLRRPGVRAETTERLQDPKRKRCQITKGIMLDIGDSIGSVVTNMMLVILGKTNTGIGLPRAHRYFARKRGSGHVEQAACFSSTPIAFPKTNVSIILQVT
uniref:Uncharacterized protein n=1 Tax=Odontella aurita TaxID=265563 RepID=A0A7S4N3C1_9STRA|mmetsp:Transcript_45896/g.139386  ORF Transcript_45896/g.139386 Transcript_45896/m.139386 type:complete len:141 (+) Transcript_45896:676-1098(+)